MAISPMLPGRQVAWRPVASRENGVLEISTRQWNHHQNLYPEYIYHLQKFSPTLFIQDDDDDKNT